MKTTIIILLTIALSSSLHSIAQVYFTKNGRISFFSKTALENISADNNQVLSVLNTQSGLLQFSLLNNAFYFPKAKMQEDFNQNYMESDKYPKSTFKGNITNLGSINFSKEGNYEVQVNGELTIHGITKTITSSGTMIIKNGTISIAASFKVLLTDYNITTPNIVTNKIAKEIEVTMSCNYNKKSSN